MSRTVRFDGKNIKKPGAYSRIISGIKNGFVNLPFGGLLVIDTGSGAGWGGGAGISGTLKKNGDAVYHFESLTDFQDHVKGGDWWKLGEALFLPNGINNPGISYIDYVRASATTPATITLNFTGGGPNGGQIVLQVRDEGPVGNGILGDETKAAGSVSITAAGSGSDVINVVAGGSTTLGSYAVVAGNTAAIITTALIAAINALTGTHGYTAVALTSTSLKIYAPVNLGATANTRTLTAAVTGSNGATTSTIAFAGGVNGTKITRGYGGKMVAGVTDPTLFKLSFYRGTFRGLDSDISNGDPFDGITEANSTPIDVVDTPEFSNLNDIQSFMSNDSLFSKYFKVLTYTITGSGLVDSGDLSTNSTIKLAVGGTETYSSGALNTALDYLKSSQTSFILLDKWGLNAQHARNVTIAGWNNLEAKFKKVLYVAGGQTEDNFDAAASASSQDTAVFYNNQNTTVVHSGVYQPKIGGTFKQYDSIYHAALLLGREAGVEPQVPLTQKQIGIAGVVHKLSDKQQDRCIDRGLLVTILDEDYDPARFVCLKGCNSLQANDNLVNEDSTTASKQIIRIENQLNKEIVINAKRRFFGNPNGLNRNTASVEDLVAFAQDFLGNKIATPASDNLILSFQNIKVVTQGDAYYITYEFEPNFEVNFMLFTGVLIDPNS